MTTYTLVIAEKPSVAMSIAAVIGAKDEQDIFFRIGDQTKKWEKQAAQTLLLNKAIEFLSVQKVEHTNNEWQVNQHGHHIKSNMVHQPPKGGGPSLFFAVTRVRFPVGSPAKRMPQA